MCELLGLCSPAPVSARFSLRRLARHARGPGQPIDGWGVVLYDGADLRCYREPEPAGKSAWLRFIEHHQPPARLLISHIRLATAGMVSLSNTHPFVRELGGHMHSFAHNGRLVGVVGLRDAGATCCRPVGQSDSEAAFCILLERLAPLWAAGIPPPAARLAVVTRFAAELRALGPANFLYSDGLLLFAHADRRHQPDGRIAPPGLWHLGCACADADMALHRAGVALADAADPHHIDVFASVPLSAAPWRPMQAGEVAMVAPEPI